MRALKTWWARGAAVCLAGKRAGLAWPVALSVWAVAMAGNAAADTNGLPALALSPGLITSGDLPPSSNLMLSPADPGLSGAADYQELIDEASREKVAGNRDGAAKLLVNLLERGCPVEGRKTALLALAALAHEGKELAKAQQIYGQFLKLYFQDPEAPEVLLRQGLIYREMGAAVMALSKFYAVMSSALHLKSDRLEYYRILVLRAQCEIADTYYLQGKHEEAAEFFSRLLKLNSPELDQGKIHFKLLRSLSTLERHSDSVVQAGLYLDRYPEGEDAPEARFLYADALRKLGRNREALEQVFALLESRHERTEPGGQAWVYWQQRTGNELANQLYHEGDYVNALQIYRALAASHSSPEWQLPALYQLGLVYERLRQSGKAIEVYEQILSKQSKTGTNLVSPSMTAVLDMAKWRKDFLGWQQRADDVTRQINSTEPTIPSP